MSALCRRVAVKAIICKSLLQQVQVRKAVQSLDSAQDQLPPLKSSLHASKLDITALKKVQGKTAASTVELKKDTDILINSFLKEEKKVGKFLLCPHFRCLG